MEQPGVFGLFPNIQPTRLGGVELSGRLAWQAVREAARARDAGTTLLCYEWDGDASQEHSFPRIVARTKTQAIWRALRVRTKPRVILVWHLAMLKIVPFLRAPRARVVVFLHGIEAWRVQDRLTQWTLPRVHLFLSNSQFTYNRFLEYQRGLQKIAHCVVPLGAEAPATELGNPTQPPGALIVSRLARGEDYKGHRELIGVWARVREAVPGAQLWVAGDGDLRTDLETKVRDLQLAESVKFLGRVSQAQKQELLQACRVFAMPSRAEGFGLVYLEAMRVGRPCLVSDCDAGRQVVNPPEAGLAVNPSDPDALVRALTRLLQESAEWRAWSAQARMRYESNYTAGHFQSRISAAVWEPSDG